MPDYQHFISIVWWYIQYCHYFFYAGIFIKRKKRFSYFSCTVKVHAANFVWFHH